MTTGPGLSGLLAALLPLVGVFSIIRGRNQRKRGDVEPVDTTDKARRAATRESERRMAAYLAQRGSAGYQVSEDDAQEIRR